MSLIYARHSSTSRYLVQGSNITKISYNLLIQSMVPLPALKTPMISLAAVFALLTLLSTNSFALSSHWRRARYYYYTGFHYPPLRCRLGPFVVRLILRCSASLPLCLSSLSLSSMARRSRVFLFAALQSVAAAFNLYPPVDSALLAKAYNISLGCLQALSVLLPPSRPLCCC